MIDQLFEVDENGTKAPKLKLLGFSALIILLLWIISGIIIFCLMDSTSRGTFGDMFGAINALFSGLAFAGLIYTVLLQSAELQLQRKELTENTKQLREQARNSNRQIELANLPFFEIVELDFTEQKFFLRNVGKSAFSVKFINIDNNTHANFIEDIVVKYFPPEIKPMCYYESRSNIQNMEFKFEIEFTSISKTVYRQRFYKNTLEEQYDSVSIPKEFKNS